MNDQTRTLGAQPQGEREECDVAFAAWYDTQAHQLSNEQVCRVIWRRAWETSRASLSASPVPVAQDEREALIREMCEAMRPFAARHNEWRGWPGTWAFANAALSVVERRASLSASTPSAVSAEARHPMQPLVLDKRGVVRFKANPIVQYLLEHGGIDMNALARQDFSPEDRTHFAQLIGYSVDGWGNLSYVDDATYAKAAATRAAMAPPADNKENGNGR